MIEEIPLDLAEADVVAEPVPQKKRGRPAGSLNKAKSLKAVHTGGYPTGPAHPIHRNMKKISYYQNLYEYIII